MRKTLTILAFCLASICSAQTLSLCTATPQHPVPLLCDAWGNVIGIPESTSLATGYLHYDASTKVWDFEAGGSGGTPAIPLSSIQWNNAGAFGGSAFLYDPTGTVSPLCSGDPCIYYQDPVSLNIIAITVDGIYLENSSGGEALFKPGQISVTGTGNQAATLSDDHIALNGLTSGTASIGVPAIAGSSNKINLPTSTGAPYSVLQTDGGSPQQASWTNTPTFTAIASGTASNTDLTGVMTASTGTATYSFTGTYTTAPVCIVQDGTTVANLLTVTVTKPGSVWVLTATTTGASDAVSYICVGQN
jgi:hypothetical protein